MNKKYIIGFAIIVVFLITGFFAFKDSKIEYTNFLGATDNHKTCQVKGSWIKDKESGFDPNTNTFSFFMKDENNNVMKVVLDGARPNNFEMAESVVAKGKVKDGNFYAKEVLTKCPSKYEGKGEDVKKSGI
jgi:cytochrome c-type biogenesis protein CcmE